MSERATTRTTSAKELKDLVDRVRVDPGSTVRLRRDFDPGFKLGWLKKNEGAGYLEVTREMLAEYQDRLAAQSTHGLIVVLQGIDGSGKDGTIKHVMSGVNPQGVTVHSFKAPSEEELSHDFLWRHARALPERGRIGIFNRSHYEEVLVARVHPELLEHQRLPRAARRRDVWQRRYREINNWERYLYDNGFRVVKLLLNISREEQRRRFLKRIDRPEKNWKFSASDVAERASWDDYQRAFSDMLSHTSTEWAPWYVIPSDHKWFGRITAAAVIVQALIAIDPQYPALAPNALTELAAAHAQLEAEAPDGAPADAYEADHASRTGAG